MCPIRGPVAFFLAFALSWARAGAATKRAQAASARRSMVGTSGEGKENRRRFYAGRTPTVREGVGLRNSNGDGDPCGLQVDPGGLGRGALGGGPRGGQRVRGVVPAGLAARAEQDLAELVEQERLGGGDGRGGRERDLGQARAAVRAGGEAQLDLRAVE